jgi:nitric oxide reductase large subunit
MRQPDQTPAKVLAVLVAVGWFVYAFFVNPVWTRSSPEEDLTWFVIHAGVAVGFLVWHGWARPQPVPREEENDAA